MPAPDSQGPARTRCAGCGFENVGHTLFCQDCGARLPTPPPSYQQPTAPTPAKPAAKPARIRSVRRAGDWRSLAGVTVRTLVYAAAAAFFIQLSRPPRALPPPVAGLAPAIVSAEARRLAENAARGRTIQPTWAFLNAYLAGRLVSVGDAPSGFVQAQVAPWRDGFTIYVQQRVFYVPLTTAVSFKIVARSNGLALEPVGASIGRIPLPAWAAGMVGALHGNLASALRTEIDTLRGAGQTQVFAESIRVDFAPRSP